MRHTRLKFAMLAAASLLATTVPAFAADPDAPTNESLSMQPSDPAAIPLERLSASPGLSGASPRGVRLSPDGSLLTMLRPRPDNKDRFDLWALDMAGGSSAQWRMLVDSTKFGATKGLSEAEKMQRERARIGGLSGIVSYSWSPDSQSILIPYEGDLFLAARDGSVRRLTTSDAGELNPVVSPKGGYVSFVRDQNLWVQSAAEGAVASAITTGEGGTVTWGEAEFVVQEELDRSTGYWWSPDDRRIAVARFDEAPVAVVKRAAIGATGTSVFEQRYPAAGTDNVLIDLFVMDAAGKDGVKVDLGSNPDIYLARVDWAPDGRTLYVQRLSRDQSRLDLLQVDPATGASKVLISELAKPKSWINLSDNYRFLADGSIIWPSERDGYAHLYHVKGGKWTQLTKGPWVVTKLVGVDEAKGKLYLTGTKDDVLAQQIYAMDLAKANVLTRVSDPAFVNYASMDKAGQRLIVSRSNDTQPSQIFLADTAGQRLSWIEENRLDAAHPYTPYLASHQPRRFGTIKADDGKTDLHWEMITPPLEPGKTYPVWFEHYGGPHAQNVTRDWAGAQPQHIVDRGFIYFQIDNRGSDKRGRAFEDAIYHAMGGVEVADQAAGARYLQSLPFVDAKRIVTYGWSYGGYMTLKMLAANPGLYAAGIAGAPVTKWELYDTAYTERYLGDPRKVPEVYAKANALDDAVKITDPLLLIHGMSDDNVVFENSTALAAKLQEGAVPFEMMIYPGQTHRVGGPGISVHLMRTMFDFLDRRGLGPTKPAP